MSKAKTTASPAEAAPQEAAAPVTERRPAEHSFARADADQKTVVPVLRRRARCASACAMRSSRLPGSSCASTRPIPNLPSSMPGATASPNWSASASSSSAR